jgi:transcriptional regulator with XRE-family HTH domain
MNGNLYNYKLIGSIRNAKYTQDEFAKLLNITVVTLSRLENGHSASYELIMKACQLLDIDSSKIFYSSRQVSLSA